MSTIPPSLIAFESQLGAAIRRRWRRHPLRFAARGALVTVALAAVAFGVVKVS